ncbi:MAG TPA: CDP-alcohol phosphatidyltransferase family protein [Acidimicrobiales bacterium]|nr:CDP-alcohol phosphatidyltransferase family protein [Acidimicrobiales bacterium]
MNAETLPGDLGRVATVPNALSIARVLLVGVYLELLFGAADRVGATVVLAIAGTTDFADGYIARRFDQVTTLGKVLDPVADRILLGAAISSMIAYGAVPVWLAAAVLGREGVVAGTVLVLAARGAPRIDVSRTGKAATFGLMVCFPLLLLGHGRGAWAHAADVAGWVLAGPSLALSLIAALGYIPTARRAIAARTAAAASVDPAQSA